VVIAIIWATTQIVFNNFFWIFSIAGYTSWGVENGIWSDSVPPILEVMKEKEVYPDDTFLPKNAVIIAPYNPIIRHFQI